MHGEQRVLLSGTIFEKTISFGTDVVLIPTLQLKYPQYEPLYPDDKKRRWRVSSSANIVQSHPPIGVNWNQHGELTDSPSLHVKIGLEKFNFPQTPVCFRQAFRQRGNWTLNQKDSGSEGCWFIWGAQANHPEILCPQSNLVNSEENHLSQNVFRKKKSECSGVTTIDSAKITLLH